MTKDIDFQNIRNIILEYVSLWAFEPNIRKFILKAIKIPIFDLNDIIRYC